MAEPFLKCPEDWMRGTLEPNSALGLIDQVDSGGTPSTADESYWDGEILWLTPKEVTQQQEGLLVSRTERKITRAGLQNSGAKLLPVGTVLLTKRAPVGEVAVNTVPLTTNQGFLNFRCGRNLLPMYLAYWLIANRPYLELVANGSTYPELYKGDLFEFEISVPTLDYQRHVVSFFRSIEFVMSLGLALEQASSELQEIQSIHQQTYRLRALRDTLLPPILSGEVPIGALKSSTIRIAS